MHHCPECGRLYPPSQDVCPECWERVAPGTPRRESDLSLVYETGAAYEADMVEALLQNEGIPCLRVPSPAALLWPVAGLNSIGSLRLFVRADMAAAAAALIAEVTWGGPVDP